MKIVIDSNRVIAAMMKGSTTREILFDQPFEFIAPDYLISEVSKYEDHIIKSIDVSKREFEILLAIIFEHITIIPESEYKDFIDKLKDGIKDPKDLPYLAACIATKAYGIWSHDPHFKEQEKIKVLTNIDMLKLSGKTKKV